MVGKLGQRGLLELFRGLLCGLSPAPLGKSPFEVHLLKPPGLIRLPSSQQRINAPVGWVVI